MLHERGTFIPRPIVLLVGTFGIICALLIGFLAFFLPASRVRRYYALANCTVISASISCDGECRRAIVISPSFEGESVIILSGKGTAPCTSDASCDEEFRCRYKETTNGILVRETVSAFPLGLTLFVALAGILAVGLALYISHDALRACGLDLTSGTPVFVVMFMPPGVGLPALVQEIKARWPRIEARGLSYRTYDDVDGHVPVDALRAFQTEARPGAAGMVFCVGAHGRNERAILDAVPDNFYRVLLLPRVEDCVDLVCGGDSQNEEHCHDQRLDPENIGPNLAVCEVEQAHKALSDMAGQFDSVYAIGALEFGNNSWIAMRAVSPYVPFRLGIVSFVDRLAIAFKGAGNRILTAITRAKPRDHATVMRNGVDS